MTRAMVPLLSLSLLLAVRPIGAADRFTVDDHGVLRRRGTPFLPIFVWCTPSTRFEAVRALGVNTVHPGDKEELDPFVDYVSKAHGTGLAVLGDLERFRPELAGSPDVVAWSVAHEPDITDQPSWRFNAPASGGIYLEGEQPESSSFAPNPWLDRELPQLSGGRWLTADESGRGSARYRFDVPPPGGPYTLWVREFNKEWANPTAWQLDGGPRQETPRNLRPRDVMRMGQGRDVGWCRYGSVDLAAGEHTLDLAVVPGRTLGRGGQTGSNAFFAVDSLWLTPGTNPPAGLVTYRPRHLPAASQQARERLRSLDPQALAWNILTSGFYGNYRRIDPSLYDAYVATSDIVSFDHYPITGWNRPDLTPEVGLATAELVRRARFDGRRRPVWTIVEASDQDLAWTPPSTRGPTPAELRCQVWSALANGATGIGYFTIAFNPFRWENVPDDVKAEMRRCNGLMTRLADLIVAGEPMPLTVEGAGEGALHAAGRRLGDRLLVIAANVSPAPLTPVIRVDGRAAEPIEVCEEGRTVPLADGAICDTFEPLAVHVYLMSSRKPE